VKDRSGNTSTRAAHVPPDDSVIDEIELADHRRIVVRPTLADDGAALRQLTIDLPRDDARRRYFTASTPRDSWFTQWASINERGGYGIVAVLMSPVASDGDAEPTAEHSADVIGQVIGEAGYALLPDGDGELALTVAQAWRGWLGAYLLDLIVTHAAEQGIENLQADVLLENRPMLALLRHRGAIAREHPGGEVRLSISTTGHVPSWPPNDGRPRVLVEVPGGRWSGESYAEAAGVQVAVCSGPAHRRGSCPALCEGGCPLVDGADAIAVLLDPEDPRTVELIERHHSRRPTTPLFVRTAGDDSPAFVQEIGTDGARAVATITDAIDDRTQTGGIGTDGPQVDR
jgi:hypothetical protein